MDMRKALLYILLIFFGVGVFTFLDFKDVTVPYDDAYSVFMVKLSYTDIVSVTAKDVHPPLYYWGLKVYSSIVGDSVFALRTFSMLGVLATLLLGCFPIRRLFGDTVAIVFIVLLIIFPVTQYVATDIRMYSWTMFFVLACALSAYRIYQRQQVVDWLLFFATGLSAAYMHNYGLLSILGIYICLFVAVFFYKKESLRYLSVCGLIFSLAYLPWLYQLIDQIKDVSGDYWIKPLTVNDLFLHIYYFYSPKEVWLPFTNFSKLQMMIGVIAILGVQLIVSLKVLLKGLREKDITTYLAILSFCIFLFPVFIGGIVSIAFVPVLVTRYMTCSFGLFVLSLAFILSKTLGYPIFRKLSYLFFLFLFIDGGIRLYSGLSYYNQTEKEYSQLQQFAKSENGGRQILIANDFSYHVIPRLQIISPDNDYAVWVQDQNKEIFEPFSFDEILSGNIENKEFVLVRQDREAIQEKFRLCQLQLQKDFLVVDSLRVSDIILYKMKHR